MSSLASTRHGNQWHSDKLVRIVDRSGTMRTLLRELTKFSTRMAASTASANPIAVFDSGVGGLTVLKAIQASLPQEDLIYLGDTARLPYGTKSKRSITRYALRAAAHLRDRGIKMLVVACNTASAVALDEVEAELAPIPVLGVVRPGAQAAVSVRPGGTHLVLATEATVALGAYSSAICHLDPGAKVTEQAAEMLVALAEEGWTDGDIARQIVARYLEPALHHERQPDTVILGCTHFPLLTPAIRDVAGDAITLVDSANTTAAAVADFLRDMQMENAAGGTLQLLATDGARRFARVGGAFLDTSLDPSDVELVDL